MEPRHETIRYLSSKKTVDDRALNQHVWKTLVDQVTRYRANNPFRVIEIGAGIGTMAQRVVDWGLFRGIQTVDPPLRVEYTALDTDPDCMSEAERRLAHWGHERGFKQQDIHPLTLTRNDLLLELDLLNEDVFQFAPSTEKRWDLVLAHAFLDLTDLSNAVPLLLSLLRPGGLFYFTIGFDGETILQPELNAGLDNRIENLYHEGMDKRVLAGRPSGDSRAGRRLFHILRSEGAQVIDMGSSDWTVFPIEDDYPADEMYFLRCIIDTIAEALRGHPDLNDERFVEWIERRIGQINERELVYIAHQIDLIGRSPGYSGQPQRGR